MSDFKVHRDGRTLGPNMNVLQGEWGVYEVSRVVGGACKHIKNVEFCREGSEEGRKLTRKGLTPEGGSLPDYAVFKETQKQNVVPPS